MTARHVVDPPEGPKSCITKVRVNGQWVVVQNWAWWYNAKPSDGRIVDLAVLKLKRRVDAYILRPRGRPAPIGTNLAAVGHPLGNQLSVNQGRLIARKRVNGIPVMLVNLLGAEGASGSAFVDNQGRVVGLLQIGIGTGVDLFGQHTSGSVTGLDLSSWWGNGKQWLCKSYPDGGIPMCGGTTRTPPPPAPAPPPPAPPPPAPAPPPVVTRVDAGNYQGTTNTGDAMYFEITTDRKIVNVRFNDFREDCDGPIYLINGFNVGPYPWHINDDGSFLIEYDATGTIDATIPSTGHVRISGSINGSVVTGTAVRSTKFTDHDRTYTCGGTRTWTAARLS